jgi:hypothetical protein
MSPIIAAVPTGALILLAWLIPAPFLFLDGSG